jgi:hypothetical protein
MVMLLYDLEQWALYKLRRIILLFHSASLLELDDILFEWHVLFLLRDLEGSLDSLLTSVDDVEEISIDLLQLKEWVEDVLSHLEHDWLLLLTLWDDNEELVHDGLPLDIKQSLQVFLELRSDVGLFHGLFDSQSEDVVDESHDFGSHLHGRKVVEEYAASGQVLNDLLSLD